MKIKKVIRVIDLLKLIANKKKVPEKIYLYDPTLIDEFRFCTWEGSYYVYDADGEDVFFNDDYLSLNDKVGIIDTKEKI